MAELSPWSETARRLFDAQLVLMDPGLRLRDLVVRPRHRQGDLPFPLDAISDPARLRLVYSGTAAVYQAVRMLGIRAPGVVLLPAYCCGHEVEAVVRAGADVDFYRVDDEMNVDLDDLARQLRDPVRAILVTHYFGFAQPVRDLRKLCDEARVPLIEDCAHAFLSSDADGPIGAAGDLAVFSLRKTLAIPDGGALRLNRPELARAESASRAPLAGTFAKALDLWQKSMMRGGAPGAVALRRAGLALAAPLLLGRRIAPGLAGARSEDWYDPDHGGFDFPDAVLSRRMSRLSTHLLARLDATRVREVRRQNYTALLEALSELGEARLPRRGRELPEGTCPWLFPIRHPRPVELARALFARGVSAEVFWPELHPRVPWARHPEARQLKASVLVLPVHQDLAAQEIERIGDVVRTEVARLDRSA